METNQTGHFRLMSLVSSSAFWVAALLSAGLIGGLWLVLAAHSAWAAVPLVAVLVLTAVAGITWQQSRASARSRLHAALAAYAERELRQQRRRAARLPRNAD
jgi:membrane protein DedA with SNARE-associated domain